VNRFEADPRFVQDGLAQALLLLNQGYQEMLNVELLLASAGSKGLGGSKTILQFFGEAIDVHK
jgi:hypothetical protein